MAHLAIVVDADSLRRGRFMAAARRLFGELPGTTIAEHHLGACGAVWAVGPRAPVGLHRHADGFALLIGYGVADDGRHVTAADLADAWLTTAGRPAVYDGYHVAAAWSQTGGLAAGVDPMGIFPLQFASLGSGPEAPFVVATTPAAFRCHEGFVPRIDRHGLAGILMVHGPLHDRPLMADTQRLPKGRLVRWTADRGAWLQESYRLTGTPPPAGETAADRHNRIEDAFVSAIRRHRPANDEATLLLSGGLDSRLVAGTLAREGIPARPLALGRDDDFEVIAARGVARRLGMPLDVVSTETVDGDFPARTRLAARFGQLTSAPGADDFAEGLSLGRSSATYLWSGAIFDWVFEPVSYADGRDPATATWSLDGLLAYMNRWGVPRDRLPALLGEDGPAITAALIDEVRGGCLGGPDAPELAAARIRWDQRIRNHVASAFHRTTFHAWPLMPATDRRFIEAVFGLSVPAFQGRVIEEALLRRICPELARVPLDSNSFRFDPLDGSRSWLGRLTGSALGRVRRLYWTRLKGHDPRRYERLFNVDHPRWRAARRDIEPLRPLLHEHLTAEVVAGLLPQPEERTAFRNPVNSGGQIRLLLGLAVVLEDLSR
jgi:asparagine synthase (glutamine-hydrolysing)